MTELAPFEAWANGLVVALEPAARRALARDIARRLRDSQSKVTGKPTAFFPVARTMQKIAPQMSQYGSDDDGGKDERQVGTTQRARVAWVVVAIRRMRFGRRGVLPA